MNIDKLGFGLFLGLILPIITAILFYNFAYHGFKTFDEFLEALKFLNSASMFIAVCALSNLAAFLIFANFNKLRIARGIFLMTLVYAMAVVVIKFLVQQ